MVSQNTVHDQFKDRRFFDPSFLAGENSKLNVFDEKTCFEFRDSILKKYPELAYAIKADYHRNLEKFSLPTAHLHLLKIDKKLQLHDFNLLSDLGETSDFAQAKAQQCGRLIAMHHSQQDAHDQCLKVTGQYKITSPNPKDYSNLEPILNRLSCHKWWKRKLSTIQNEIIEEVTRHLQLVHAHKSPYSSHLSIQRFTIKKKSNREFLESQLAINELDEKYSLAQLSDKSVSNPAIRRMELIVRCKGFETVAEHFQHEGIFITLTTPSRFHRMTKISNPKNQKLLKVIENKNYDTSSPKDAQDYLVNLWAKIQSKLSRENIKPYGFRVAEPHHDGTPHWHFLLFVPKEQKQHLKDIFTAWSLLDSPEEKGAQKYRIKIEDIKKGINPETGKAYSATGYIIKYICKNIDGHGVDNSKASNQNDWSNTNAIESAINIEAWARDNRIRQFQQIGGPSVTTWRELRRLEAQEGTLERLRHAADSGDWASFVIEMGGPNVKRKDQTIRPVYAASQRLDTQTGEISAVTHTRYGDEAKDRVVGILITGITVLSRTHIWSINENETITKARQKIMNGIVEILDEIQTQNSANDSTVNTDLLQSTKSAALDLFQ
jgi:hypothetical protein